MSDEPTSGRCGGCSAPMTFQPKDRHPCPGVWVNDGRCGGQPCIEGTRITTALIAQYVRDVMREEGGEYDEAVDEVIEQYPRLDHGQVDVAVAFEAGRQWALEHSRAERTLAEIEALLRREDE